jgi:magnesium-transporting ATPase (P-type)
MDFFFQAIYCIFIIDEGRSLQAAMIDYLNVCGIDIESIKDTYPDVKKENKLTKCLVVNSFVNEFTYDFDDKVLAICDYIIDLKTGNISILTNKLKAEVTASYKFYKETKYDSVVGIAYRYFRNEEEQIENRSFCVDKQKKFIFIGLLGFRDIIRRWVPKYIKEIKSSGIEVKMITEDYKHIAELRAKECGIISGYENPQFGQYKIMSGDEFYDFVGGYYMVKDEKGIKRYTLNNLENFKKIYKHVKVIARASSKSKLAMVIGLQKVGEKVSVIG